MADICALEWVQLFCSSFVSPDKLPLTEAVNRATVPGHQCLVGDDALAPILQMLPWFLLDRKEEATSSFSKTNAVENCAKVLVGNIPSHSLIHQAAHLDIEGDEICQAGP